MQLDWLITWIDCHCLIEEIATVGAMDLGGASTQISVEVAASHVISSAVSEDWDPLFREEHISELQLYGRNYSVFTQSSLCYGVDQVILRYQSMLINVIIFVQHFQVFSFFFFQFFNIFCQILGFQGQQFRKSIFRSTFLRILVKVYTKSQFFFCQILGFQGQNLSVFRSKF